MLWVIRLKECKRCGGDLSMERDRYGSYKSCLQCGAIEDEVNELPLEPPAAHGAEVMSDGRNTA